MRCPTCQKEMTLIHSNPGVTEVFDCLLCETRHDFETSYQILTLTPENELMSQDVDFSDSKELRANERQFKRQNRRIVEVRELTTHTTTRLLKLKQFKRVLNQRGFEFDGIPFEENI